jgi:PQQ-dependent catabolism-associated beta-propeller protein
MLVNTSETTNMAHFIDTDSHEIVDNVLVDTRPRVSIFDKDGKRVWITSEVGGTLRVLDGESHELIKKIKFEIPGVNDEAIQPVGVRLTSDGKYGFVALGPANRIAVIDAKTLEIIKYILVGQRVWQLALTPDEKLLVSTNGVSNDVTVINVEKLKAIKSIKVGRFPWGIVIQP